MSDQDKFTIGGFEIVCLRDGTENIPLDACVHPAGSEARQRALGPTADTIIEVVVNFFLLQGEGGTTLIDAGTGAGVRAELGHGVAALKRAGVDPADVDRVLLTHLHFDHARGLLEGETAAFPKAEIFVSEAELSHFTNSELRRSLPIARQRSFEVAENIERAYRGRIRSLLPGPVLPGLEAKPLPGHTPGHTGFRLTGESQVVLFSGDLFHLREAEIRDPDLCLIYDFDMAQTAATRRMAYEASVAEDLLLAASHVDGLARMTCKDGIYSLIDA